MGQNQTQLKDEYACEFDEIKLTADKAIKQLRNEKGTYSSVFYFYILEFI